jgi:hypothetical protein
MSLINEALKRTRDASYQAASSAPFTPAGYQPVRPSYPVAQKEARRYLTFILLLGIVAAGGALYWMQQTPQTISEPRLTRDTAPTPVSDASSEPHVPAPPPVISSPVVEPATPVVSEDVIVARVMEKLKEEKVYMPPPIESVVPEPPAPIRPTPHPATPPSPPVLVLQGIMVHGASRHALINGQTVCPGDFVEGARLTRIENRSVILRWHDTDLMLRMP